jgi:predicted nuclease with RNAse H fold
VSPIGSTVVGIDVGGARKGFHAVALQHNRPLQRFHSTDAQQLAAWCNDQGAELVAVDAPCRWRDTKHARAAERQLLGDGIACFLTPSRPQALASSSGFYGWMFCGEALYRQLDHHGYPLAQSADALASQRCCVETFPHAITCQLHRKLGLEPAQASRKREQRGALLERLGVDCRPLSSIDWIDAALCAVAAQQLRDGADCWVYGDAESGLLLLPAGCSAAAA